MVASAKFTAIEVVAKTSGRATKRRRTASRRSAVIAGRSARVPVVVATVIPDRAVIATMVPMIAMVIAVMVMIMIAVMVMIVIVMMVVVTEKVEAPGIEPDETVVGIEVIVTWRTKPADAGVVGPIAFPLVAPPVAADPVVVVAVYVAIVERTAIPFTVEIDRTIGDRIVPEIGRTAHAVAIATRVVGKSYSVARSVAEPIAVSVCRRARNE